VRVSAVRLTAPVSAAVSGSALCLAYVLWRPFTPDLAAQLARADLVRRAGDVWWWTGWFGGLSLPTYSVISPAMMATLGVSVAGALLTVAACWGAGILARDTLRPRAGAVVFSLFAVADLLIGRVTFAIGLGFAVWALVALRARVRLASAVLTLLCYLSSPLAGLFLGMVLAAVVIGDHTRRRQAVLDAGLLLISATATEVLFPQSGVMHSGPVAAIPTALGCGLIAVLCRARVVRAAAVLTLVALPVFLLVPTAVGSNVERLAWVCAVPVLVACAPLDRGKLAFVVTGLTVWPAITLGLQVHWVPDPTTQAGYYRPLLQELRAARATAGPAGIGERVEVLDTASHTGSLYLTPDFAIARGWDRQADESNNPIFYRDKALTAAHYHAWLRDLAVGWVAIPATKLDYASRPEAELINDGLPYLRLIWSSAHWRLYQVRDAVPLATGAAVTAVGPASVTLHTDRPASVLLRVRWTPYLRAVDRATGESAGACVSRANGWSRVQLPAAGRYSIVSSFDPTARFDTDEHGCGSPAPGSNH
jgi:hypothetical protein